MLSTVTGIFFEKLTKEGHLKALPIAPTKNFKRESEEAKAALEIRKIDCQRRKEKRNYHIGVEC